MFRRQDSMAPIAWMGLALVLPLAIFGCGDSLSDPGPFPTTLGDSADDPAGGPGDGDDGASEPTTGSIQLTVHTSGRRLDLDPNGYLVSVDGADELRVLPNASKRLGNLVPGDHDLELEGVASNCAVQGDNPVTVAVAAGEESAAEFRVDCAFVARPIVFARNMAEFERDNGIFLMAADGSSQVVLTRTSEWDDQPVWSPAGDRVAFSTGSWWSVDIRVVGADGSDPRVLTSDLYSESPSWSPDGRRIVFQSILGSEHTEADVFVMNDDGTARARLTDWPGHDGQPDWSPDGTRIAFVSDRDGSRDIFVMDADGSNPVNLTGHPAADDRPAWSPDGTRIAFSTDRDGDREVYVMDADGSNLVNLTNASGDDGEPAWSPDGSQLVFQTDRDGNAEIYVMEADGSNPLNLTRHPARDSDPHWSWAP